MTTTSAYVSTVDDNRTIVLPEGIPVGARVAVILLPSEEMSSEEAYKESAVRNVRFQKVMDAIRAAIGSNFTSPEVSDRELKQLIHEARQAAKA